MNDLIKFGRTTHHHHHNLCFFTDKPLRCRWHTRCNSLPWKPISTSSVFLPFTANRRPTIVAEVVSVRTRVSRGWAPSASAAQLHTTTTTAANGGPASTTSWPTTSRHRRRRGRLRRGHRPPMMVSDRERNITTVVDVDIIFRVTCRQTEQQTLPSG